MDASRLHPSVPHAASGRTSSWLNNNTAPALQTIRAFILRRVLLWSLLGLWVFGVSAYVAMWVYSLLCVVCYVATRGQSLLPQSVVAYLLFTVLYESYHYVTRDLPREWPRMRRLVRYMLLQYPYFRLNVTVFEERELANERRQRSLKESEKTKHGDDDNVEGDGVGGSHLSAAAAARAIAANDLAPCVESNANKLFAYHPHGVLTCGFSFNGAYHMTFERSACRWLSANNLFWFPLIRDILNWMEFSSCAKANMLKFMRNGQNVCIIPGGFEEATLFERGKHRLFLKNRFGFIKLALQHGYEVHPVYTFGEEYTFHTFPYLLWFRLQLNRWRIPGILFVGDAMCFYLPRNDVDLITVVGAPLRFPRIEHPTKEEVRKYQAQYVEALKDLFDAYKGVYAVDPTATLEIF
ncbi:unnamed protein product [Hyaloperonospora brassicae]|uniref:Acyltransferase n=1 Tax=Hyaloperonospora brassicae TaxID=162125 RepID=A0AAV0UYB9_HYABA|nr:unnamed protein product [Hyaloperonospora brassicae]